METIIKAPARYIQGAGVLSKLGEYAEQLGSRILVVCSAGSKKRMYSAIESSLQKTGCEAVYHEFGGETTQAEIDRIAAACDSEDCEIIAGIGGGKTIDAARGAADQNGAKLIVIPTVASNDSPCSALTIIHNDAGEVLELRVTKRSPELVLVDTAIIAKAPARLLTAGMGDALATWFEARACKRSGGGTIAGGRSSDAALALGRLCYETLISCGAAALDAVRRGEITDELERVVHANTYLSGIGFESGGVAAAHAINDGFSTIPEGGRLYHGELVGFGVLCLLMLERAGRNELCEVTGFMREVGLPMTLEALGMGKLGEDTLRAVAAAACATSIMANMPFPVAPDDVYEAIMAADRLGR